MPHLRIILVALLGIAGAAGHAAESTPEVAPASSLLREGALPNGLRYIVVPHTSAKGDISLRLVVRAGSLDEHDDERGFAHFIEHMAFQGTRRFPAGSIRYFFQGLGLTFGADLNATTSHTHTQYLLDLPEGRADKFDEALIVLRDYADGLLFPPEQVARESGVVVSELQARDNNASRVTRQLSNAFYAGTLLPDREVGGVAEQIEQATSEQLRLFYRRNYAPARMTVIVAGPLDPTEAIAKITAEFGQMTPAPEAVAPFPGLVPPPVDGIRPQVVNVPTTKSATVRFTAIAPRPPDDVAGRREELLHRLATNILQARLVARQEREDVSRFGAPRAVYETGPAAPLVHHEVAIGTSPDEWADGLKFLETEVRRAATTGFTQAEVDEAVAVELNAVRSREAEFPGKPASQIVADISRLITLDRAWRPPAISLVELTEALSGLTAAEVTAVVPQLFPEDGWQLTLIVPPESRIKPERLLAAYTASSGRTLKKGPAPEEELVFGYEDFGPPGPVVKRERIDDLDLTLVAFANGVRVNFRPSKLEPERFRLRIVFPLNYSDVGKERGGLADLAGQLLLSSELGRNKGSELARLVKLHGISAQFTVTNGTPILSVSGRADELSFALRLLTAQLSDIAFDNDHYKVALSRYAGMHRTFRLSAGWIALNEALFQYLQKDTRVTMNAPQVLARLSPDDVQDWLRDRILRGPLEVGIVGDVATEDVVTIAAGSLGTLKRRNPLPKRGPPLVPVTTAVRVEGTADLPSSAAFSCVLWPVRLPDGPKQNAALAIATDALRDRLLLALRDMLGATYAPDARVYRDLIQRDLAIAAMVNTFEPAQARQLTEGSIRLAAVLADKGLSEDQFTRLREPLRIRYAQDLRNNGWWLNAVVSLAQSRPEVLEEARRHEKIMDEITLKDVNEAAKVFQPANVSVAILLPAPPKS